jgi:diacylglycerol kinase family enzyme
MNPLTQQHVLIAANPRSGATDGIPRAEKLCELLQSDGWQAELLTDLDTFERRGKELLSCGQLKAIVAGGGDGTVSTVINRVGVQVPITILPMGSENLLAKYLEIPREPAKIVSMLRNGNVRELDLVQANQQLFLLMASLGFDAEVVKYVHQSRRSHITRWAYRWGIIIALFKYRWPAMEIQSLDQDGCWVDQGRHHWVFAFNVPKYAAGLTLLPDALIDDGLIDVGLFRGGNLFVGLWNYLLVALGSHRTSSNWTELKTKGLRIKLASSASGAGQGGVSYQLDGDWVGDLAASNVNGNRVDCLVIESLGRRAKFIVP